MPVATSVPITYMSNHIYYCIFSFFEIASVPQYGLQCAVFVSVAEISEHNGASSLNIHIFSRTCVFLYMYV